MDILKKEIEEVKAVKKERQLSEQRVLEMVKSEVAKMEEKIRKELGL